MKIEVIAAGKLAKGPLFESLQDYQKRLHWPLILHEIDPKAKDPKQAHKIETEKITAKLNPSAYKIMLDERGKSIPSREFAQIFSREMETGRPMIQFIIGGADGLAQEIRNQSDFLLSFGRQTWPHMLARVMLLEQIYRAQQIIAGHPYHRD